MNNWQKGFYEGSAIMFTVCSILYGASLAYIRKLHKKDWDDLSRELDKLLDEATRKKQTV